MGWPRNTRKRARQATRAQQPAMATRTASPKFWAMHTRACWHKDLRPQPPHGSTVYVNSVDPGVVDTGMWAKFRATVDDAAIEELRREGHCGPRPKTTMEGADSPVWMALFPPGGPSGKFWSDRREFSYVYGEA